MPSEARCGRHGARPRRLAVLASFALLGCSLSPLAADGLAVPPPTEAAAGQGRPAGWTRTRALPDSADGLNWGRSKQRRLEEIHRAEPSYLRAALTTEPIRGETGRLVPRPIVAKVAHQEAIKTGTRPLPDPVELTPPPPLPLVGPRKAQPIRTAGSRPEVVASPTLALTAGFQTGSGPASGDLSDDVFDDVLDELLPGGASTSERPTLPDLPAADASDPNLPTPELPADSGSAAEDIFGPVEGGAELGADAPTPSRMPGADSEDFDDVFGDQIGPLPDDDAVPTPAAAPRPDASRGNPIDSRPPADPLGDSQGTPTPAEPLPNLGPAEPSPSDLGPAEQLQAPTPATPRPRPPARIELPGANHSQPLAPDGVRPPAWQGGSRDVVDFNGRDCAAEQLSLQAAWDEIQDTRISAISLDITPSLDPNKPDEQVARRRENMVARVPSRVWRNRQGRVLAEGQMRNFQHGKVQIEDLAGEPQELNWYELGNEELCFVTAWWELPTEFHPETREFEVRNWTMTSFTWTASALCHKPLYFEEVQLERYGHSAGPITQAALSGVHFFGNIVALPYHIGLNPPNECQYTLGYYRPGSCAPWLLPAFPLSARAARTQLGVVTAGLVWLP